MPRTDSFVIDSRTDGVTSLPNRLALAIVATDRWVWLLLFVTVPFGVLFGSFQLRSQFANGIVGLCGFLAIVLWATSYYNYRCVSVELDPVSRKLTTVHKTTGVTQTIDLRRVRSVSIHVVRKHALIRITDSDYSLIEKFTFYPFAVPVQQLHPTLEALNAAGVATPEPGSTAKGGYRPIETSIRLVVTPITIIGVPLSALFVFGQSVLVTNGAVIVAVLGVLAVIQELRSA